MKLLDPKELNGLSKRINERENRIDALRKQTVDYANQAVAEALLQGQDLLMAKALVPYGFWTDWMKANCPRSERMSQNYMRLAQSANRIKGLSEAGSIRAALLLCEQEHAEPQAEPKRWPPEIEGITRLSKWLGFVSKACPVESWSPDVKEKAWEELEPVVKKLRPELFGGAV